jgi:hypothetical protein
MFNNILLLIFGNQTLSNLRIILHSLHQNIVENSPAGTLCNIICLVKYPTFLSHHFYGYWR